jgi:hypothetical protein
MIVSDRFVWAHIPKTGGDATATMLGQVPRLIVSADDLGDHAKHAPLASRGASIGDRLVVANTRRLPAWALSYMRHRELFGLPPDYTPQGPRTADAIVAESAADGWLDEIVGDHEIDFWIRQEHLVEDVVRFLREHAELTPAEEASIRSIGRVNDHQPRFRRLRQRFPRSFFTKAQIRTLYANNPRWAAVERRVYG